MNADPSNVQIDLIFRGNANPASFYCLTVPKAHEQLSLESPLTHFRFCQKLTSNAEFHLALRYPYAQRYQPSSAALALFALSRNLRHPPIVPLLGPTGAPDRLLPLGIAKELALLWAELGQLTFDEELQLAARKLEEWLNRMNYMSPMLFYKEGDFEVRHPSSYSQPTAFENDKNNPPTAGLSVDPHLGIVNSFTLSGDNTGLGALQLGGVQIPAFGPQSGPLNNTSGFGLSHMAYGAIVENGLEGWTRCFGSKEVWLHFQSLDRVIFRSSAERKFPGTEEIQFSVRFIGIAPGESMSMVFYVKALNCRIDDEILYPASLQGYKGRGKEVVFDGCILLESSDEVPLQVIPLAGSNCFWNTSFLVVFEFSSSKSRVSYSLKFI